MTETLPYFSVRSNLSWLEHLPGRLQSVYMDKLYWHGVFNEVHNKYKRRLFGLLGKVLVESRHVGVWGWNTWCGIHALPLLVGPGFLEIYKRTVDVGFENVEQGTGLLPHAVIHGDDGAFAAQPTYKCYDGVHGEAYNLDNIICWAKMAMEHALVHGDLEWIKGRREETIRGTLDYILENFRDKYNPVLVYAGVEGDWTECTDWELDNSNVNVNVARALQLLVQVEKMLGNDVLAEKYDEERRRIVEAFRSPVEKGGFWSREKGYFVHGNDGHGGQVHGDSYFESTANYFSISWKVCTSEQAKSIWRFVDANPRLEMPYPVLTNLFPRTGARRKNYGATVTNGDVWMVLGAHAAATRLQAGFIEQGTKMYKAIVEYELRKGVLHNCIYPKTRGVNDSWDPEIGNYGALYIPLVFGILGLEYRAEGPTFHLVPLDGMTFIEMDLFLSDRRLVLRAGWDDDGAFNGARIVVHPEEVVLEPSGPDFTITRDFNVMDAPESTSGSIRD